MKHKIAPSLLAADFLNLQREVEMINESDADWLHLDIMDGVFVPNISFGFPVLEALKPICKKPMDVHLMIVEPQKFILEVAATGAYMMNVHYEACTSSAPYGGGDQRGGNEGGCYIESAYVDFLVGRYLAGFGYGIAHVGKSGLWRAKVY